LAEISVNIDHSDAGVEPFESASCGASNDPITIFLAYMLLRFLYIYILPNIKRVANWMSQVVAREKPFMIPVELVDSQAY
jgi:hypothetical protein